MCCNKFVCQVICKNLTVAAVCYPKCALRFSSINFTGRSEFVILIKIKTEISTQLNDFFFLVLKFCISSKELYPSQACCLPERFYKEANWYLALVFS